MSQASDHAPGSSAEKAQLRLETISELGGISEVPSQYLHGWRLGVVITSLALGIFLIALDTTIMGIAVATFTSDFRDLDDMAWFGSAYLLTITAFQPSFGTLYKFFNAKYVYIASIVIFEVGSILCASSPTSSVFILGRAISGLGAAGIYQGALGIVGHTVLEKRPLHFGIVVSSFAISACVGSILCGVLTAHLTWRWCFWMLSSTCSPVSPCDFDCVRNVPIGAVVLIVVSIVLDLKNANPHNAALPLKEKMKYVAGTGTVVFMGATTCLPLALQWGGQTLPLHSSKIIGLLVGFGTLTIAFGIIQWKRGDNAIIPLRVIHRRTVFMVICLLFFTVVAITVVRIQTPAYIRSLSCSITNEALVIYRKLSAYSSSGLLQLNGDIITSVGLEAMVGNMKSNQLSFSSANLHSYRGVFFSAWRSSNLADLTSDSAVGLAIGQVLLITNLQNDIPCLVLAISPEAVIQAGASTLYLSTTDPQISLAIYGVWTSALRAVLILALVASALCIPFGVWIENPNVHVVAKQQKEQGS
ncbi:efflux pump antibiotic resistance protein [Rutstroemia sp. NJR-2017a BBW]|nr:efflux pump antibiotic resistance protein [Rutstroemia sp. NJR-2017a BBW]